MSVMKSMPASIRATFDGASIESLDASTELHGFADLTRVRYGAPDFGVVALTVLPDRYLIGMALIDAYREPSEEAGRQMVRAGVWITRGGECYQARLLKPFDLLFASLPQRALLDSARRTGRREVRDLDCPGGKADAVLQCLSSGLLTAAASDVPASRMVAGHLAYAIQLHVVQRYGTAAHALPAHRMLAGWQVERAKALLVRHADSEISISNVASACGLSRSYFIKAFRQTVGTTPHRWLLEYRIERVKQCLRAHTEPIADIAQQFGFADQSHLTRVFTSLVGMPPATWRRERCE
ncbi:transcriptional regulator, AraC family [Burkholderia sp. lig30]|jgi:AraC-like DNA-binding protein|uniref:helix-turn-helix transcriptional regulator n=1 Tax=Burkholderia sp. lig30 TaxID=1192124 RepID=UPI0004615CFA|nr:AraC family transcriptional regulator [Burkholderia sp. lig30]KDB06529.1 transcriptional regulator, AraC family [Burkholderia sp. lig30]